MIFKLFAFIFLITGAERALANNLHQSDHLGPYSFVTSSFLYHLYRSTDPIGNNDFEDLVSDEYALGISAAYGYGLLFGNLAVSSGLHLDLIWAQGPEQRKRYMKKPTDLQYAPIMPHNTERILRLRTKLAQPVGWLTIGLLHEYFKEQIGSDLVPGPGVEQLGTQDLEEGYHLEPSFSMAWGHYRTKAALVYRKQLDPLVSWASYQTHAGWRPHAGYLHQEAQLHELDTLLEARLLRYGFTLGSESGDFVRSGAAFVANRRADKSVFRLLIGRYIDKYDFVSRVDYMNLVRFGWSRQLAQGGRFDVFVQHSSLTSMDISEFDDESTQFLFQLTWSLDDFNKMNSFIDQFGPFGMGQKTLRSP